MNWPPELHIPAAREIRVIGDAVMILGDCLEVLPGLPKVDAVVTDPPYSDRTHEGHASGLAARDGANRKDLGYGALSHADIEKLAPAFASACGGWVVWMCDDEQAVKIRHEMEAAGRYAFAPLPFVAPGSRVRLTGDGPSAWTIWIVPARTKAQVKWGTLPGAYVLPPGAKEHNHMGGKPTWLMQQLVKHYTRPGMVVVDPFMGSGTTGVACMNLGRKFIGIEIEPKYYEIACRRVEDAQRQSRLFA